MLSSPSSSIVVFVEWLVGLLVVAICTSLFLLTIFMVMLMETNLLQVHQWTGRQEGRNQCVASIEMESMIALLKSSALDGQACPSSI
jgi:hypothetical protein